MLSVECNKVTQVIHTDSLYEKNKKIKVKPCSWYLSPQPITCAHYDKPKNEHNSLHLLKTTTQSLPIPLLVRKIKGTNTLISLLDIPCWSSSPGF